jgi:hypothetical protein
MTFKPPEVKGAANLPIQASKGRFDDIKVGVDMDRIVKNFTKTMAEAIEGMVTDEPAIAELKVKDFLAILKGASR